MRLHAVEGGDESEGEREGLRARASARVRVEGGNESQDDFVYIIYT